MSIRLRIALASPISLVFLWLAFHGLDSHALLNNLRNVRLPYVALYLVGLMFTQVARAARWGLLTSPFVKLRWAQVWRISNLGNMLIMLLPLRLGELSRPYLTKRAGGGPLAQSLGAAVVERVLDGLLVTLAFFGTTYLVQADYPMPAMLRTGAFVALTIFSGASIVLFVALVTHGQLQRLVRTFLAPNMPHIATPLMDLLDSFIAGISSLPSVFAFAYVVGWTLAYWLAHALGMVALMHAFGWHLPFVAGFTVVCVLVVGVMIPAGPGLLGTYQAAIMAGLEAYSVGRNEAGAFSVVAYMGNLLVIVGCGLPYLLERSSHSVRDYLAEPHQADTKS